MFEQHKEQHVLLAGGGGFIGGHLVAHLKKAGFQIRETSYVWQTFEGISKDMSSSLRFGRPVFRSISSACEHIPLVKRVGVSQFICAQKPE